MSNTDIRSNKVDLQSTKLLDFHQRRITNAADAVDNQDYVTLKQLKDALNGIGQIIHQVVNHVNNSTTITSTAVIDIHTLSASSTLITPSVTPAPANGMLVIILKQDATGGRLVTWSSDFLIGPPELSTLANTYSCFIFGAITAKWLYLAPPMTGRS